MRALLALALLALVGLPPPEPQPTPTLRRGRELHRPAKARPAVRAPPRHQRNS